MRFLTALTLILLATPSLAQQELRARVELQITDVNNFFQLTVWNNSSAQVNLENVRLTPNSGVSIDTLGSFTGSVSPVVGTNADGQSAPAVLLTPTAPIIPGGSFTLAGGDFDGVAITSITVEVKFADRTPDQLILASSGGALPLWSGVIVHPLAVTYPINLSWDPPTQNEDGTPYLNPAGYRIYWGNVSGTYNANTSIPNPATVTASIQVPQGGYYIAMTAVNNTGIESDHSNEVSKIVGPASLPPTNLSISVDPEDNTAWLVFTIRNQILFVEAGVADPRAACDPEQLVRGILPTDQMPHTLNLVAVEDVTLLPSIPGDGELAVFAECSAN
jgi:hypothetical protein